MNKHINKTKEITSFLLWGILLPILLYLLITKLLFFPVMVDGNSMFPTIRSGDLVIVSRLPAEYLPGDIILFVPQKGQFADCEMVKRIVAGPNQEITIDNDNNTIYIDRELYYEDYAFYDGSMDQVSGISSFIVPEGCYFVLGDNRAHSLDSRCEEIGYVSIDTILGKIILK